MNATKTFNPNSSDPENLQNFNSPLDKHLIERNLLNRYMYKIQDILSNKNGLYPVVKMNIPIIQWASKKGYVRILSATQVEWTSKGINKFSK